VGGADEGESGLLQSERGFAASASAALLRDSMRRRAQKQARRKPAAVPDSPPSDTPAPTKMTKGKGRPNDGKAAQEGDTGHAKAGGKHAGTRRTAKRGGSAGKKPRKGE